MQPLVTIAVPLHKRMHFLPDVLRSVAAQDYPEIELLISDNGLNGPELRERVEQHYPRPYTFRRNEVIEEVMSQHFNQLVEAASGKYFVLLCDDDEIGPEFASSMVEVLESDPEIGVAIPNIELTNEAGELLSAEEAALLPYSRPELKPLPPETFTGSEFVHLWVGGKCRFKTFVTTMARTAEIRAVGGYPPMPTGDDDAVALKLSLGRKAAFCEKAVFRNRAYEASGGLVISPWVLAADIKRWIEFLDADPVLQEYAAAHPGEWPEIRELMRHKAWGTYRHRWKTMYRERMGRLEWLRAGFALPYIPEYYRWLAGYLLKLGLSYPTRMARTLAQGSSAT
jgi:cellulose synthase/poly-beta-1,6-N-acetylglucosamine synthase-like glycosyltransferase